MFIWKIKIKRVEGADKKMYWQILHTTQFEFVIGVSDGKKILS